MGKPIVLLVADEETVREFTPDSYGPEYPLQVKYAHSGSDALAQFTSGGFDVVVFFTDSPRIDCTVLLREMRMQGADIPVIIVYREGKEATALEAITGDLDAYPVRIGAEESPGKKLAQFIPEVLQRKDELIALKHLIAEKESILNTFQGIILYIDHDYLVKWTNRGASQVTGKKPEEILGKHCYEVLWGKETVCEWCKVREVFESGSPITENVEFSDGRILQRTTYPVRDDEGTIIGFIESGVDVTKVKQAEKALKESQEKYTAIFDNVNDAIMLGSILPGGFPGVFIEVNEPACRMLGYTREELLSMTPEDIARKSDWAHAFDVLGPLIEKGEQIFEWVQVHKDGTEIPVEVNSRHLDFGDQKVYLSVCRNITERKKAQAALAESEERFRGVTERSSDLIMLVDAGGKAEYVSPSVRRILGYEPEEIVGAGYWEAVHPDDFALVREGMQANLSGEVTGGLEIRIRKSDGSYAIVELTGSPVMKEGMYHGLQIIGRDITERKKAELELQKLASIVRFSSELIALATPDGIQVFINDAGARILGGDNKTLLNRPILDFVTDDYKDTVTSQLIPGLMEKGYWEGDLQYRNITTGALTDVHAITFTIKDPDSGEPRYLANVSLDITERKWAEEALKVSNKKLNILSSITRHDILNQLTMALAYFELIDQEHEISSESVTKEYLGQIYQAFSTINRLTTFTRDYQNLGVQSPVWMDVRKVIDDVAGMPVFKDHRIIDEVRDLEIYADPLLEKVIYNLFDNAWKHGETITRIRFSCQEFPDHLALICEDDGVGIPEDVKEKIFTREHYKHTGLGLFLSREILSITGLSIQENGTPGEGARFEITVPEGMYRIAKPTEGPG